MGYGEAAGEGQNQGPSEHAGLGWQLPGHGGRERGDYLTWVYYERERERKRDRERERERERGGDRERERENVHVHVCA